jgi:maltose alpha-D-glucosyltransferase / alpha-amylase
MIDDLWYKNGVFYCLSVGTYMDANGDGIGDFKGYFGVSTICTGWA